MERAQHCVLLLLDQRLHFVVLECEGVRAAERGQDDTEVGAEEHGVELTVPELLMDPSPRQKCVQHRAASAECNGL